MIWVYAICDQPGLAPPRQEGLAQAPLEAVVEGDLVAVVTRHEHGPPAPSLDVLWVHEGVVERLMSDRAVLPMRFGTSLADEESLRRALATRRVEWRQSLERVRGRVELGLRAIAVAVSGDSGEAGDAPGRREDAQAGERPSGRSYLMGKLEAGRRNEQAASALHEPLSALAVEARRHQQHGPGEVLRAAYLVEAPAVSGFQACVEALQEAHPGISLLCTGPWPAYSFVSGAGSEDARSPVGQEAP